MTTELARIIDIPCRSGGGLGLGSRRDRRRAIEALRALDAVGERCAYRLVMPDGSPVPPDQVTEEESAEVLADLEQLGMKVPPSLPALLDLLYAASSSDERSRIAPTLDQMLEYVDRWSTASPARIVALFEQLDPSRVVRAVGQTLLAATRQAVHRSVAREAFLTRFLEDLRVRGAPEATIRRLEQGLEL